MQQALAKAAKSQQPAATLLKLLRQRTDTQEVPKTTVFESRINRIRRHYFGEGAGKKDFYIVPVSSSKDEVVVNFRIRKGETRDILKRLCCALEQNDFFTEPTSEKHTNLER